MRLRCVETLVFGLTLAGGCLAAAPRVLPAGQRPDDVRLGPLKTLDGYFPFTPPATAAQWAVRADRVRRRILVAEGLWPMPTKTPLHAVSSRRLDRGDYTVENVFFESAPGFYVTGNLYRPKGVTGRVPGVLMAHGHFPDARWEDRSAEEVREDIADGAERFEEGGRNRFQSMCVQLARMGCVVWQWDMLGYCDSQQLSLELIHRYSRPRPEMNTLERWGLYSAQAEAHLESPMGLQTLDAERSLDFLLSLPDVDPTRIAMTGASGGGTQTILLGAIDPRIRLSFPMVMVSTAMQGGCSCENASLLRVGTGNVEFAALFAPRPQGMTNANDWTKELPTKGFPELKQVYALLNAPGEVSLREGEQFPHNDNAVSRSAFYTLLNRAFKLGQPSPVIERDYRPLGRAELSVWDAAHPAPKAADSDFERGLLTWWTDDAAEQRAAAGPAGLRKLCGPALDVMLDRRDSDPGLDWKPTARAQRSGWTEARGLVRSPAFHETLPAVVLRPERGGGPTVVWISPRGKAALWAKDGGLAPAIRALVAGGATVIGADLLAQGEFLAPGAVLTQTTLVASTRPTGAYTFGYNDALFVERVHDVITLAQFARTAGDPAAPVRLAGLAGAGPWVAAARAELGAAIEGAAIDTGGFRFGKLLDMRDPNFLPGGAKLGDLPAMLALGAPGRLWLAGESPVSASLAAAQYAAEGAADHVEWAGARAGEAEAVAWLLRRPAVAPLADWPASAAPRVVGERLAENFLGRGHRLFTADHVMHYAEVCAWYGALRFARAARDPGLEEGLAARFHPLWNSERAVIPRPLNVDCSVFGALPLELAIDTGDVRCRALGLSFADAQWASPDPSGLSGQTRFWIDDMYMITLLQTQAYRATGDARYLRRAAREAVAYLGRLQQPNGLFHHAPDAPFCWGRGNGWFAAGMAELLDALPPSDPDRPRILAGYRRMMAALLRTQGTDGMWRQLVDDPGSWPESSGTGMFTFAFLRGVREGWLDPAVYAPAARRGWLALVGRLDADGSVRDVCESTNKGQDRAYYLQRARVTGDLHGQAPLLWCAAELLRPEFSR